MSLATLAIDGPLATLTLNRPEARNALSVELLAALHDRVDELQARCTPCAEQTDSGPHVCIVTGAGKALCAGMDLKAVLGNSDLARRLLLSLAELTYKLRRLPCVTVASVHGPAIGGGCGLVTVCDLAVTFADNKMGFPEVDLGVCPAVVGPWLVRKIGAGRARRVLLSGGLLSGREAEALGIVNHCVATAEDVHPAAMDIATRLASGSAAALRATKNLLNDLDGSNDWDVLEAAANLSADVLNTPETQAMLRAKLQGKSS
ncbi:MAG: enoyl-CoA hydratase/isomerase family protein [Phycisphaerales bacterium]|jgi:methylglutaconyl-CoA hydratase|nr:enoyl-CoA hydratase/isomerase family protein [Phycisphaerales bacterium]